MFSLKAILSLVFFAASVFASLQELSFIYNGFRSVNLSLGGIAELTSNGLLKLSNASSSRPDFSRPDVFTGGHALFPTPLRFKSSSNSYAPFSFSTSFVFVMHCENRGCYGTTAFVIALTPGGFPINPNGNSNETFNGNLTNHVVTVQIYDNNDGCNVGIYVDRSILMETKHNCYYRDINALFPELSLNGLKMQVWVDYSGVAQQMNVTLAPVNVGKRKPIIIPPLLSFSYDLSSVINETMYVGFSSNTTGTSHYIMGWSFRMNGPAEKLDLSRLPKLPWLPKEHPKLLTIGLPMILICSLSTIAAAIYLVRRQKKKFAEEMEDWELEYGPHRFKYKDLYVATNGFRDKQLLGRGGFGKVYRGVLPVSQIQIAVKRVSQESRQGMKEFVAEIVSLGRLRHRNLAALLGYCRRRDELLLVYDYMPNGSLDKYLYNQNSTLNWSQRFRVIKGVATGLLYLHEKWEQVVIHRDVKPSNVLLDNEWNARLGDFGLARLYDHGSDPHATKAAGTLGYLAPEHARTGKATTSTDVYAFGALMLEVACGRRPIKICAHPEPEEDIILVNCVFSCWNRGAILEAIDPNLGYNYVEMEAEMVLKLGLLCSQSEPKARPSMRQVILCLEGELALPELLPVSGNCLIFANGEGFGHLAMSDRPCMEKEISQYTSVAESILSGGR